MSKEAKFTMKEMKEFVTDEAVRYIVKACADLRCTIPTRCKALVVYHHFRSCVLGANYDSLHTAAGCVSFAVKYHEEPIQFDAIVGVFYNYIVQASKVSTEDEKFMIMKTAITSMEYFILRMTEFCTTYQLAHDFLPYFIHDIQDLISASTSLNAFVTSCTKIASDFYLSNKCMKYTAPEIASTVIQIVWYLLGVDVNKEGCCLKLWLKKLCDVEESKRKEIIQDVFQICDIGPAAQGLLNTFQN